MPHEIGGISLGIILICCGIYASVVSVLSAVLVLYDKHAARSDLRRVSERTLLLMAAICGSVAMLITMRIVRHKTKHAKFMYGLPLLIIMQIATALFVCWYVQNSI